MQNILKKIKSVTKGQKVLDALTAEWMNGVKAALYALSNGQHIRTGPGVMKREHGSSCSLDVMIVDEPMQETPPPFPWEVYQNGSDYFCRPATLNGLVPSNIFEGLGLDDTSDAAQYIIAYATTDGKSVNAVELSVASSSPDPQTPTADTAPTSVNFAIAVMYYKQIFQIVSGNITVSPHVTFLESRTAPSAGQEPFIRWWLWQ